MTSKIKDGRILSVKFYQTETEHEPVRDWLKSLRPEDRKKVGEDIKTVEFGWPLGMPLVRKLDSRLWEVRTDLKDGIARTLFTIYGNMMVLLHGFIKKSQKTSHKDLEIANKRKNQVLGVVSHEKTK